MHHQLCSLAFRILLEVSFWKKRSLFNIAMDKFSFTLPTSSDYDIVPLVTKTHKIFLYLELLCRQRQAAMVWWKLLKRLQYACLAKFIREPSLFMQIYEFMSFENKLCNLFFWLHRIWKPTCLRAWTRSLRSWIDAAPALC